MSRKIETLLRIVSEMRYLDECSNNIFNETISSEALELSENELNFVAAATITPIFTDRQKSEQ